MLEKGLDVITKMRRDANMYYLYQGEQKSRGRKRTKGDKVNWTELDTKHFKLRWVCPQYELWEAVLYSVSMQRKLKVCLIKECRKSIPTNRYALLCSTDLEQDAQQIYQYYSLRFQIEFCFRDAKQHCGLQHCQSRKEERLDFHFNASMTTLNLAKALQILEQPKDLDQPFSMASIKTKMASRYMIKTIFTNLGLDQSCQKSLAIANKLIPFGAIAA
jgi:hypothetical protein